MKWELCWHDNQGRFIATSAKVCVCVEDFAFAEDCRIRNQKCLQTDEMFYINNTSEMPICTSMMIRIQERTTCFDFEHSVDKGRDSDKENHMLGKVACTLEDVHHVFLDANMGVMIK